MAAATGVSGNSAWDVQRCVHLLELGSLVRSIDGPGGLRGERRFLWRFRSSARARRGLIRMILADSAPAGIGARAARVALSERKRASPPLPAPPPGEPQLEPLILDRVDRYLAAAKAPTLPRPAPLADAPSRPAPVLRRDQVVKEPTRSEVHPLVAAPPAVAGQTDKTLAVDLELRLPPPSEEESKRDAEPDAVRSMLSRIAAYTADSKKP